MKLTVTKSRLEACVKNLRKVINKKNVLPIMSDIMFDVDEEKKTATLSASDTEIWLTYTIQLEDAQGHGKFCVPAQQLQAMMSELKEQPLTLIATTESTNIFTMEYENGSAHCAIDNADEYPMPAPMKVATDVCYNFDAGIMNDAIKRSLFAMATDEFRIVLNGVYLNFHNRQLDTVATNGMIIIRNESPIDENMTSAMILPKKVANIMPDIVGDNYVNIITHDNFCKVEVQDNIMTIFQFRTIEGKYPNYNSVIPEASVHTVACDRLTLLSALKAVSPFTNDSSNMAVLTFNPNGVLEISGEDADISSGANVTIGMEGYDGEPMAIGMKASAIISILQKLSSFSVSLSFDDPNKAIMICPADKSEGDKETITCLLMPMLIND
jgi:DNA polymerase-3 subunit beta